MEITYDSLIQALKLFELILIPQMFFFYFFLCCFCTFVRFLLCLFIIKCIEGQLATVWRFVAVFVERIQNMTKYSSVSVCIAYVLYVCSVYASVCRSLLSVCSAWHLISQQSQSAGCAACYYKSRLTELLFVSIFRPQHYVPRGLVCQPGCVSPAVGGLQLWLQHDDIWRTAV